MEPSHPNNYFNLGDSEDHTYPPFYETYSQFQNSTQEPFTENPQTSLDVGKEPRSSKWDAAEDVALMSAWCLIGEDNVRGKNQKTASRWAQIKQLYDATQLENLEKIGKRNEPQMRGRFKRLNENVNKWVAAYREAYRQRKSGMSLKDVENQAQKIYEQGGSKFNDSIVFNEVMCKHPKWDLQLNHDTIRSRPEFEVGNEESGGSTKRSRTTEEGVISCFSHEYLRRPTRDDLRRLLHVGEERGFPGMIGSIDCMHWQWKNCPTAWAGQYAGRSGKPTIILEAVASFDLWIWHAFFGTPGSCNDINVLHRSPIFDDVLSGRAPNVTYAVNGREYNTTYYITDGIYPPWAAFVKSISSPQLCKHKLFAQHQEAVRKDVERAFGVLQVRFAFLRHPCLVWDKDMMGKIMIACIIMHNMIVEDERDTYLHSYDPSEFLNDVPTNRRRRGFSEEVEAPLQYSTERIRDLSSYMRNREQLRNRDAHKTLKTDLIEHIWQKFGIEE